MEIANTRPIRSYYYEHSRSKVDEWLKIGAARTRDNAARAAIMRVLDGTYYHVDIYDADGVRIAFIRAKGVQQKKITVVCV